MYLEKEDVTLYYELRGKGDALILIHGLIVDAEIYHQTAELLARHYQVITYDRRGNSRSVYKGEAVFYMEDQVSDIRDLMDTLQIENAYIVGVSAGAVIGQHFFQNNPERVKHLIMYEPAMFGFMMADVEIQEWVNEMKQIIKKRKFSSAVMKFVNHIGHVDVRSSRKPAEVSLREMKNHEYALTQECPGLFEYQPDMKKMRVMAEKITIAVGERSGNTAYVKAALRLGDEIGRKVIFYPGCHNLPYDLPKEFAICVLGTLMLID